MAGCKFTALDIALMAVQNSNALEFSIPITGSGIGIVVGSANCTG
jgi:ABC-type enterobactin transport system permease subunit